MQNLQPEPWRQFRNALDGYEKTIRGLHYPDLLVQPSADYWDFGLTSDALPIEQTTTLLDIKPPHGYALIRPAPLPAFPGFPTRSPPHQPQSLLHKIFWSEPAGTAEQWKAVFEHANKLEREGENLRSKFEAQAARWKKLREECVSNERQAIRLLMSISNVRHPLPKLLQRAFDVDIDLNARIALCTVADSLTFKA